MNLRSFLGKAIKTLIDLFSRLVVPSLVTVVVHHHPYVKPIIGGLHITYNQESYKVNEIVPELRSSEGRGICRCFSFTILKAQICALICSGKKIGVFHKPIHNSIQSDQGLIITI